MKKVAFAIGCHPDDIEFMMAGTLMLLGEAGYELHYMNVANGCCGSMTMDKQQTIDVRLGEAKNAAEFMGAAFHPPLVDDLMVRHNPEQVARLCAVIREVAPSVLLLPSPQDYMEDHMNTCRIGVTAAFCRGMPNFETLPPTSHIENEMAVYHAMPYGLRDDLRNLIIPHFYVDVAAVAEKKRMALALHASQKQWLDESQGMDSYIKTMDDMAGEVGAMSGKFELSEGWRRHNHIGFAAEDFDPLCEDLKELIAKGK